MSAFEGGMCCIDAAYLRTFEASTRALHTIPSENVNDIWLEIRRMWGLCSYFYFSSEWLAESRTQWWWPFPRVNNNYIEIPFHGLKRRGWWLVEFFAISDIRQFLRIPLNKLFCLVVTNRRQCWWINIQNNERKSACFVKNKIVVYYFMTRIEGIFVNRTGLAVFYMKLSATDDDLRYLVSNKMDDVLVVQPAIKTCMVWWKSI